ncbi:DUF1990 domain-containing protein [Rhodococcus maanshanensis]|uniref:DUF1990 family protein n=1 Tax=Rhodococcus TaxID=1827 RepID=UPI00211C98B1|nr:MULTISPECIES: DUF1990 domain-containing protein [Rhodococcus]MCZ4554285.1 DUF1990 domain-containing protein [Rhodococcus maanshanensis]
MAGMDLARLQTARLTYPEVGGTRAVLPDGYHHVHESAVIGVGVEDFERAKRVLLQWDMHRRAGLRVRATDDEAVEGAVVILRLGPGPLAVTAPCRVVYRIDEPRRSGFAYGTLPGHPERGEERFAIELGEDGRVRVVIDAFSTGGGALTRLCGPANRVVQRLITRRYLDAFTRAPLARRPS